LHYYVYCANVGADDSERAYYDRLSAGYAALTERDEDEDEDDDHGATVVIDCADGVGGVKLSSLGEAVAPYGLAFDLRNRGDEPTSSLNDGVGSDFVQKGKSIPTRGGFENLPAGTRCVSIDGDADRLVYFQTTAAGGVDLVDGDQLAVLIACWMNARVKEAAPYLNDITVGVVQTAYANGASTEFLTRELGAAPACVPTGVKHLHHRAEEFDIGVYFESNGHGTALFSPSASKAIEDATVEALVARDMPAVKALLALTNAQRVINPSVGDAMSGILLVEAILRRTVKAPRLGSFYKDLPSRQTKVVVADRTKIQTFDAERRVAEPEGLQDAIDAIVRASNDARCRAFVRPSGTEDCVRVYVEASEETRVEETTRAIVRAVEAHCG
jgi:phosphoacetylglucosamine mutase